MTKAVLILCICTLAFVSAAVAAQAPSVAPLTNEALTAILGQPAVKGACPAPQGEMLFAARGPAVPKSCSAQTTCWDGTPLSCQWTGTGGTCTSTPSNCDFGTRGSVNCNGTVTSCPQCPCGTPNCCQCDATGDCFACCRCGGGGAGYCIQQCGGI